MVTVKSCLGLESHFIVFGFGKGENLVADSITCAPRMEKARRQLHNSTEITIEYRHALKTKIKNGIGV